jgi:TOD1/MUCI70, glycosyltransferase-like domain
MIAYTATYGGYDDLKPHPEHPLVDEWIAYTDDPSLDSDLWEVRYRPLPFAHPRLSAKWWKCHPPEADATVWIDGSVVVHNPDYFDILAEGLLKQPITMFHHPDRNCIYQEVEASRGMAKYAGLPLDAQAQFYASRGWPVAGGLWASTTFARRHTAEVLQFGAAWFAHNELLTYQDQLSLPILLLQYGLTPSPIPGNLWRNDWFYVGGHASEL